MKRILAIMLCLIMAVSAVACSGGNTPAETTKTVTPAETTETETPAASIPRSAPAVSLSWEITATTPRIAATTTLDL